ncbi:MAG: OmpA family protein [Mangrovibacterium sp.]
MPIANKANAFGFNRQLFCFVSVLFILLLLCSAEKIKAQDKKAQKYFVEAKSYYQANDYKNALVRLTSATGLEPHFIDAYLLQADIYADMDSVRLQIETLKKALAIDPAKYPKAWYVLGNACYALGEYEAAAEAFRRFLETGAGGQLDDNAKKKLCDSEYALQLVTNPVPFQAISMGAAINTDLDEYWPSLTIDGKTFIFTRLLPVGVQTSELMPKFQEDFFESRLNGEKWDEAIPIVELNTMQNEGAQSVSADGKLIFFTACNQSGGYGSCDIYFTRQINGTWIKAQNAGSPVNSGAWESQPSISANGEYLYFVSNRAGGKGKMDIWRCRLVGFSSTGKPVWEKAENLGHSVNTSGNEMSPFIYADGASLYFASDFWPGLGGNDLFLTRMQGDSIWMKPLNLGFPINSYRDEQGLIVDASGTEAYYSSDRPGSKGVDIYKFKLNDGVQPTPVSYVSGRVVDAVSGNPVCSKVELINLESGKRIAETETCLNQGEFLMCLPLGNEYAFNVSKPGYLFYSDNFALKEIRRQDNPIELQIELEPVQLGRSTVLRNIFFESDSYELLQQSRTELFQLVLFMQQNPSVTIEIGGHTDNLGTAVYNLQLSQNRAKAVYEYLLEAKVAANRLAYKGYGLTVPVTGNDTAEGRAMNRRTEFKIIQVGD